MRESLPQIPRGPGFQPVPNDARERGPEWIRIGLVLIGYADTAIQRLNHEPTLPVAGQIDVTGEALTPLDANTLAAKLPSFLADPRVDAIVVSGTNSPMNPLHEAGAAGHCRERAGVPVLEARFLGDELNAMERAREGIASARELINLRKRVAAARREQPGAAEPPTPSTADLPPRWIAAWSACNLIEGLDAALSADGITASARVTRLPDKTYGCHCDDARYAFGSLLEAKRFAETHLEQTLRDRARRCGMADPVIHTDTEDRFAHGKGRRGPMRVFLESRIRTTARTAMKP